MRIRELEFRDFRAFRGRRRISFVDPLTDAVRPVTVIAGTNGTGKTTILDTIEGLLSLVHVNEGLSVSALENIFTTGFVHAELELHASDAPLFSSDPRFQPPLPAHTQMIHIAAGRRDLAPATLEIEWPDAILYLVPPDSTSIQWKGAAVALDSSVSSMRREQIPLYGGLIYFPHGRQPGQTKGGPIEPPLQKPEWIFRYSEADRWQGSLEQLWVWENYLDLEQRSQDRAYLKPFVSTVEHMLGAGRTIIIKDGRVHVPPGWSSDGSPGTLVRLDQLPSGEQQLLLLFGELARRRRRGAILMIDEPETSLHPTLQRKVIHQLRTFVREWDMQLIIATHSLEILRAVHESERIILDHLEEIPTEQVL